MQTIVVMSGVLTLTAGESMPKFPNPYNMMDKGKATPYMGKTFGVNTYNNYAYGYAIHSYGYYPVPVIAANAL